MAGRADASYARRLGAEIRNRRLARGMSLRALAKELHLRGHGTLVDYELGRRVPPEDLILGCERVFQISDGALRNLRDKALAERANQQADLLLVEPAEPVVEASPPLTADGERPDAPHRRRRPQWRVTAAVAVVLALAVGVGAWRLGVFRDPAAPAAAPSASSRAGSPPVASRTAVASWGVCWGGQVARLQPTDAVTYAGARALQITVNRPNTAGDFATCTTHGLESVHPGMTISVLVRVPASAVTEGGLGFFVYDSKYHPTWAPQTPEGVRQPLPGDTGWHRYEWTVPAVDTVHTLGVEVYSATDQPLILWLGAVSW